VVPPKQALHLTRAAISKCLPMRTKRGTKMTCSAIPRQGPHIPAAIAAAVVLAVPSAAHAHGASDKYGEAIVWFGVLILVAVVGLVIAVAFAIAWLVGMIGRSKSGSPGGPAVDAGKPALRQPPDTFPGTERPPGGPQG
jgi:hypothetical protein